MKAIQAQPWKGQLLVLTAMNTNLSQCVFLLFRDDMLEAVLYEKRMHLSVSKHWYVLEAGLCNPEEKLLTLHQMERCSGVSPLVMFQVAARGILEQDYGPLLLFLCSARIFYLPGSHG
ncbi:hypothetical protein ACLOJK_010522 [Asimina triloba]